MMLMLSALLLFCGVAPVTVAAKSKVTYASRTQLTTWLWDAHKIIKDSDKVIAELVSRNVNVLLLQIDDTVDVEYYRQFIRKASLKEIKVEALDGAPQWVAENGAKLQQVFLDWLIKYQATAAKQEKFTGIHLDVEPYEHEHYDSNSAQYLEAYQTMIIRFRNQADKLRLNFGIDIPFWFYGVNYQNQYGSGNMAEWLCKQVSNITIMAYRDTAKEILSISAAEMKLFQKYKVRGTIAVETGRLSARNNFVTFYEETKEYMDEQLEIVYQAYKNDSAFQGIAIHYYDSWVAMK